MLHRYLIALGSNIRHHRHGPSARVLRAAVRSLGRDGLTVEKLSPIIETPPLGPSRRRYANGAAVIQSDLEPHGLLAVLQETERRFGRRRSGRRWGARILDIDLILWDGGSFASNRLIIPHSHFRSRNFVLAPGASIAPNWRDPISGQTLRQLQARLTRPHPIPR